jgi:hypothetical protein
MKIRAALYISLLAALACTTSSQAWSVCDRAAALRVSSQVTSDFSALVGFTQARCTPATDEAQCAIVCFSSESEAPLKKAARVAAAYTAFDIEIGGNTPNAAQMNADPGQRRDDSRLSIIDAKALKRCDEHPMSGRYRSALLPYRLHSRRY